MGTAIYILRELRKWVICETVQQNWDEMLFEMRFKSLTECYIEVTKRYPEARTLQGIELPHHYLSIEKMEVSKRGDTKSETIRFYTLEF